MTSSHSLDNDNNPESETQETIAPPKRLSYKKRKKLAQEKFNPLKGNTSADNIISGLQTAQFKELYQAQIEALEREKESKGETDNRGILVKGESLSSDIIKRDEKGRLLPGVVLNPTGAKGAYSLKTKITMLLKHNPDIEARLIRDLLQREGGLVLQMIDGKPTQAVDITTQEAPKPILAVDIEKDDTSIKS